MKSNLIGIFLLTIILIGCNKSNSKNDWDELNLNGEVKSIIRISYDAKEGFGEVMKGRKSSLYTPFYEDLNITFYQNGMISKKKSSNSDSTRVTISKYESNGTLKENISITEYNEGPLFEYLKKINSINSDGLFETKEVRIVDDNGNYIEYLLGYRGDTIQKTIYVHNLNNDLVKRNIVNFAYGYDIVYEFAYDE